MTAAGIEVLGDDDAVDVVAYVAAAQADPARHVPYVGEGPDLVDDLASAVDWRSRTFVARGPDGGVRGVLTADVDDEMGRLWWLGPWADDDVVAHQLLAAAEGVARPIAEREFSIDSRNELVAAVAGQLGYVAEEPSLVLVADLTDWDADAQRPARTAEVREPDDDDLPTVAALHDRLFPGTHTRGRDLVRDDETSVLVAGDPVRGYVATQVQRDRTLYVDFIGVEPAARGRGLGRALVAAAMVRATHEGLPRACLTVRRGNRHARALYRALGFDEEREATPWRLGFRLDRQR